MSYLNTKKALLKKLIESSVISTDNIAFENKNFDPNGKDIYIDVFFNPVTADMMGKTSASSDEQRGFMQISVFVKQNSNTYDYDQLSLIDQLISEFSYNSSTVYNNQKVDILNSTVNSGRVDGGWFIRDITINYLTFSER